MVSSIDRNFANTQASLYVLGTSHRLASRGLSGFRAGAPQALRNMRAETIVNADMHGQLLLSTSLPFGNPLSETERCVAAAAHRGKRQSRSVGSLYRPDREPVYLHGCDPGHEGRQDGLAVGRDLRAGPTERHVESAKFAAHLESWDGIPVVTVYSRSRITRWSAAIGMPLNELSAGLRQTPWARARLCRAGLKHGKSERYGMRTGMPFGDVQSLISIDFNVGIKLCYKQIHRIREYRQARRKRRREPQRRAGADRHRTGAHF
jgi:hypothetical protein